MPWPTEIVIPTARGLCSYLEPKKGAMDLWGWARKLFEQQEECHNQFIWRLYEVIGRRADPVDRSKILISHVPSPQQGRSTSGCYDSQFAAACFVEALRLCGYDIDT